jgi:hypothetical protein
MPLPASDPSKIEPVNFSQIIIMISLGGYTLRLVTALKINIALTLLGPVAFCA